MFCLVGMTDLNTMNGLKNLISGVLTTISVVIFSVAGLVHWPQATLMMVAATVAGISVSSGPPSAASASAERHRVGGPSNDDVVLRCMKKQEMMQAVFSW